VVTGEEIDLEAEVRSSCIPLIPGAELDFGEVISRGSSCEVIKGKWRGCEVAIKQFHDEYKENQKELSKFIKEMQTLAQVRHPNLILLMGICLDMPHLCLITEFVPNMSLFAALHSTSYSENKAHKLTIQERFQIAIQVCKGLAYLHACDPPIVHRDLKPENCLLDFNLSVKIADFGLARPLTCFSSEEALTTTCIGTTRFMAPELFERERSTNIGVEVDIWALGCVLIELFSGKRPWDYISSANASCIFYEIFKLKPIPIPENMPSELRDLTSRCCQYQPHCRPSAAEVLLQLEVAYPRYLSVA
jgi:serine/threonine protein kinase